MMENKEQNTGNKNINQDEELNNVPSENQQDTPPELEAVPTADQETIALSEKMAEMQDKYLRLSAEFDNYRKRTLKERYELIKTAGEDIINGFLPIIDDFDRAIAATLNEEQSVIKDGILLIYDKMMGYLKQKGLAEIDAMGKEFDTDYHEAVSKIPVPDKDKKGKVFDVLQKGYMLNDKVIRFAKVVVAE